MDIDTPYAVKLFFPNSTFVQVFFEAIANAFDAKANEVAIHIVEDPLEITIADNGRGFTDENFERFCRLTEPSDPFHKGLGRLVYLAYFKHIRANSTFDNKHRSFIFSTTFNGKSEVGAASEQEETGTTLRFTEFSRIRLRGKDIIKPQVLKDKLMEQFLPLFHKKKRDGEPFKISIKLQAKAADPQQDFLDDEAIITESDVPELRCKTFKDTELDAFDDVSMFYILERVSVKKVPLVAVCIDGRTIPVSKVLAANAIPPNYAAIFLFESKLFAGKSDNARQTLVLPESITEDKLRRVLRREVAKVLGEQLPEIKQTNTAKKLDFEDRYPHLVGLFDDAEVGLIDADEMIENAQKRFFKDQRSVLESETLDVATYEKTVEISSRALTEYILYREWIIKRMSAITGDDTEATFHNLIAPQRRQFHGKSLAEDRYINNAWLLDDKFMTFRTLLSEAMMQDVITAIAPDENVQDEKRPDISMIFSDHPARANGVDVVIVELKRRRADPKETTFAGLQLVQRAMRLVNYFPTIQRVWYFAVIEIDQPLADLLMVDNYIPLFSRGEHVYYREFNVKSADGRIVPTPVCLLSFDAIIKDAAARNHAFLGILKDHFKKAAVKAKAPIDSDTGSGSE